MLYPNNDFLKYTLENPENCDHNVGVFNHFDVIKDAPGVLRFEPNLTAKPVEDAKPISLVLSTGIHGNETGPMELVNDVVKDILNTKLRLAVRLLVIVGNPYAALKGTRFCDVNLNRLFLGAYEKYSGLEVARAIELERCVTQFFEKAPQEHVRLHYDLHTAIRGSKYKKFAVHPFVSKRHYDPSQFSFLTACGIDALLLSHQPTTTFSYYSYAMHGAHAFTVELGKVQPFGCNDLSELKHIDAGLRALIEKACLVQSDEKPMKVFKIIDALIKDSENYRLNIDAEAENFTLFDKGTVLAQSEKGMYQIEQAGDAIVFPNTNIPLGQRAGLVVREVKNKDLFCEPRVGA
ncbi:succinylglutamate desuccinylase [Marinomonas balearica]|uniref:Succinylglutamate desuccinylase n=1 Tax=Marinomonas balearica TaxID=491947 RepID=A0A4R6M7U0_9GAMM|nr:succinylglutamate desuccinylase [Marinomonas balearica]TDO96199.1 succinylglutamate desuccinylase [Marinomonas balearica]